MSLNTQCNVTHNWIITLLSSFSVLYIFLITICALQTTVLCDEQFLLLHFYPEDCTRSGMHPEFLIAWH